MYVLTGCTYRKPKGHKGKRGKPLSKRGRSLRHYPDQTQSSEFGQKEEGESQLGDDHGYLFIYMFIFC